MFKSELKDFKSPMSTIPPRGQTLENKRFSVLSNPDFDRSRRTKRSDEVGTVTQNPAQLHKPIPISVESPAFQADFWSRVNKSDGCWEYQGLGSDGYGRVRFPGDRSQFRAHRVAYRIEYDVDPSDMMVCHKCDNPACVKPDHLFLGTAELNNADKIRKGRASTPPSGPGALNPNSKITEAEARGIIGLILEGLSNKSIAERYAVGHSMVSRIRVGRSWHDLAASMGYTPKPAKGAPKSGRTKSRLLR